MNAKARQCPEVGMPLNWQGHPQEQLQFPNSKPSMLHSTYLAIVLIGWAAACRGFKCAWLGLVYSFRRNSLQVKNLRTGPALGRTIVAVAKFPEQNSPLLPLISVHRENGYYAQVLFL